MSVTLKGTDNTVTAPAYTGTDSNTGLYFPSSNAVALSANGVQALLIDSGQNITIAKGLTVGSNAHPAFSVYRTTNQTITNATPAVINFNAEKFDTANAFDNVTNFRFVAPVSGYYQFNARAELTIAVSLTRALISIFKNGTEEKRGNDVYNSTSLGGIVVSGLIYLSASAGDYVDVRVYMAAATCTVGGETGAVFTWFDGCFVRSA